MDSSGKGIGIQDVAKEAGVSKTSVSNYLNGRIARLSSSTAARIRETIERLNYSPSLGARRLSSRTASRTIAAVIRHDLGYAFRSAFFPPVMDGIGEACEELGYRVILIGSMNKPVREDIEYALSLARGIVDGFLLFELEKDDPYLRAFERAKIPYVCFGRPDDPAITQWVASDQGGGVAAATEHLWAHGHRRIALFPGRPNLMVTEHRVAAFRATLAALGGEWDASLVQYDYSSGADSYPVFSRLLAAEDGPTAYIVGQIQAAAFRRACADARTRTRRARRGGGADSGPGRDDGAPATVLADYFPPEGDRSGPRYTYVKSHVREVGVRGAARLIERIRGMENDTSELFPTELVLGDTCGCGPARPGGRPTV